MKHVSILIPQGQVIVDTIIGSLNLFQMANSYHRRNGLSENGLFNLDLVGTTKESHSYSQVISITPTKELSEVARTDLIIIPGFVGDMQKQVNLNYQFVDWIKNHRIRYNTELASLCRGAFLLAETGLMSGKSCATHWLTHDDFRRMYPNVNLVPGKVINEDNGVYSSGGAYSFLSLLLYLIEKHYGRETAIWCSKVAEIEFDRVDQNQFIIFNGQKNHGDQDIAKIQDYIEQHFREKINIEQLAEQASTSSRNFIRRFKKATNNTPIEYLQRVRIEAAKKELESSTDSILQVMYGIGYNDDKTFRTIFKRYTGMTPLGYRNRYNREMALV